MLVQKVRFEEAVRFESAQQAQMRVRSQCVHAQSVAGKCVAAKGHVRVGRSNI